MPLEAATAFDAAMSIEPASGRAQPVLPKDTPHERTKEVLIQRALRPTAQGGYWRTCEYLCSIRVSCPRRLGTEPARVREAEGSRTMRSVPAKRIRDQGSAGSATRK